MLARLSNPEREWRLPAGKVGRLAWYPVSPTLNRVGVTEGPECVKRRAPVRDMRDLRTLWSRVSVSPSGAPRGRWFQEKGSPQEGGRRRDRGEKVESTGG